MSLLANMNLPPSAPQTAPPAPTDPAAAMAHLREQERLASVAALPPAIAQNWACVKSAGMGTPPLGGIVARAVAIMENIDLRGDGLAGSGQIGSIGAITTADLLQRLADELAAHVPTVNPRPYVSVPQVLPPDAPVSNPTATAVSIGPATMTATQVTGDVIAVNTVPPPSLGGGKDPVAAEAPKRGRGRPKKVPGDLETAVAALSKAIVDVIMIATAGGDE